MLTLVRVFSRLLSIKIANIVLVCILTYYTNMRDGEKTEMIHDYNGRDYRTVWEHPRAVFENRFEGRIIQRLLTKRIGWFIDIGAGYGRVYPVYKRQGRKIVLLDYAMNLLEIAAQEYSEDKDIYFVAANAYHLPFKNELFDGGISVRVFHHINLPEKFMREVGRVMRSGSEMILEYANKRNMFRVVLRGKKSLQKDHEEYGPLHYGTHPAYFQHIAHDAGFRIERTLGTGFFPRFITKKTLSLAPLLFLLERFFDATFGRYDLGPLNFANIKKIGLKNNTMPAQRIEDILRCPACGGEFNFETSEGISCIGCKRIFHKNGKIFDLRYEPSAEE